MWNWSTAVAEYGAVATFWSGQPSPGSPTVRDPEPGAFEVTTGGERGEGGKPESGPGAPATPMRDRFDLVA
ncbi:hypothetical protein [Nocardia asteroides]|uniref:hypothetical protein n=1 Tax=Nocardia asteroides TaxID=1824 RepID=UPI001E2FE13A|nr:hypothetical protein [Nocardia asteroides]UGT61988.1 hypothetical protein LTT61_01130 [Nocardia asteroides]